LDYEKDHVEFFEFPIQETNGEALNLLSNEDIFHMDYRDTSRSSRTTLDPLERKVEMVAQSSNPLILIKNEI